jgi:uncharacterized DUF497 family protein
VPVRFSWDPHKAALNERGHGVPFIEAVTAFHDPLSITIDDPEHSLDEERLLLLGWSSRGRLLVVSHVDKGDEIRLISARLANRRERKAYEEEGC